MSNILSNILYIHFKILSLCFHENVHRWLLKVSLLHWWKEVCELAVETSSPQSFTAESHEPPLHKHVCCKPGDRTGMKCIQYLQNCNTRTVSLKEDGWGDGWRKGTKLGKKRPTAWTDCWWNQGYSCGLCGKWWPHNGSGWSKAAAKCWENMCQFSYSDSVGRTGEQTVTL